jgi:hypothetical protein
VQRCNNDNIWIPNSEHYGGYTDRHAILSNTNIIQYLNVLESLILQSNDYYTKMETHQNWNLEQLIKFHLQQNNTLHLVREFPYIMYAVRNIDGSTRWAQGQYSEEHGYYIKYHTEYDKSTYYKSKYNDSGRTIDEFYSSEINPL